MGDTVHLWHATLDRPAPAVRRCELTLDAGERQRAASFRFVTDRHRFIVAHGILRKILAGYLHLDQREIRFRRRPTGACGISILVQFSPPPSPWRALSAGCTWPPGD